MKGVVLEDDVRLNYTKYFLKQKGVEIVETLNHLDNIDFVVLGMNPTKQQMIQIINSDFYHMVQKGIPVYTGVNNEFLTHLCKMLDFDTTILLEQEEVINQNALLTAEATISEVIQKRPYQLNQSKAVLIGYGHCGKAIYKLLEALEVQLVVIEKDKEKVPKHIECIDFRDLERLDFDILINTAPFFEMSDYLLQNLSKDQYLFDIASFPYGYDHLKTTHLNDYILSKLPSKYGYKSAGKILADFIWGELNG